MGVKYASEVSINRMGGFDVSYREIYHCEDKLLLGISTRIAFGRLYVIVCKGCASNIVFQQPVVLMLFDDGIPPIGFRLFLNDCYSSWLFPNGCFSPIVLFYGCSFVNDCSFQRLFQRLLLTIVFSRCFPTFGFQRLLFIDDDDYDLDYQCDSGDTIYTYLVYIIP